MEYTFHPLTKTILNTNYTPPPNPRSAQQDNAQAESICSGCRTSIPAAEQECATCRARTAATTNSATELLLHWAVFLLVMGVVFGGGYLLAG
ncbi:hypothetical protein [Anianabacter salinae]|uniref:hypothetical protein n=1 Tax=Anianabacter salinae TaxID=2851023 RepID=UPI00225E2B37|nr:hypothetical protein [Anianabacter salinae]MBV0912516.1 hypothetical protein [Anianabacter salinae]